MSITSTKELCPYQGFSIRTRHARGYRQPPPSMVSMFIEAVIVRVCIGVLHVIVTGHVRTRARSKFVTASRASKFEHWSSERSTAAQLYQKLLRFSVALASSFSRASCCGAHVTVTTLAIAAIVKYNQRISNVQVVVLWACSHCRPFRSMLKIASRSWRCFLSTCTRMLDSISTTLSPSLPFQRMVQDR